MTKFYYLRNSPPDHTITEDKVLYVFVDANTGAYKGVVFLDKYNLEWDLKLPSDIRGLTFQGMPIVRYWDDMGSPSNFVYRNLGPIYMLPMNTPSFHTHRPMAST